MAKERALASVHGSLQERETENAAIRDELELLHVRIQQLENTTQGVNDQRRKGLTTLTQCFAAVQRKNNEAKELAHKCLDLLDLYL